VANQGSLTNVRQSSAGHVNFIVELDHRPDSDRPMRFLGPRNAVALWFVSLVLGQVGLMAQDRAPASLAGRSAVAVITSGTGFFASSGSFRVRIAASGQTYQITPLTAGISAGSGICSYIKTGPNAAELSFVDSGGAGGVYVLDFSGDSFATYSVNTPSSGRQTGAFVVEGGAVDTSDPLIYKVSGTVNLTSTGLGAMKSGQSLIELVGDTTIIATTGSGIGYTVYGPYNLTVIGDVSFSRPVGFQAPLKSLTVQGNVTSQSDITVTGALSVGGSWYINRTSSISAGSVRVQGEMTAPGTPIIDVVTLADVSVGFLNGQSATWNISYGTTFVAQRQSGSNIIRKGPTAIATGQSRLINIATRGYVDSQKRLVGGFVVSNGQPRKVLVRGVGKTLGVFGVPNATGDTVLEVYDAKGAKIFENDDWQKGSGAGELPFRFSQAGAFGLPAGNGDSALALTLPPGSYTVHVFGKASELGEVLLEAYELPD
jgi:hypothetical protein